jgi:hypothetical protein
MPNPRSLANLKPWAPGESGNLRGRPPRAQMITNELRKLLEQPANAMELEVLQPRGNYIEAIARNLLRIAAFGNPRHALTAASIILDRLEGRPAQRRSEDESNPADQIEDAPVTS